MENDQVSRHAHPQVLQEDCHLVNLPVLCSLCPSGHTKWSSFPRPESLQQTATAKEQMGGELAQGLKHFAGKCRELDPRYQIKLSKIKRR